jgi:hypothetical protein
MLVSTMENRRLKLMGQASRNRERLYFEVDLKEMHNNDVYAHYRFGR